MVVLGDSLPAGDPTLCDGCTPFPVTYGKDIEDATGTAVTVLNEAADNTNTADVLSLVRTDPRIRREVAHAGIVVVMTGHNDTPWVSDTDACDGARSSEHAQWDAYTPACVARAAASTGVTLDHVLTTIETLRQGKPTAFRVVDFYNDNEKDPLADPGGDASSRHIVDVYSRMICRAAQEHSMPCVDAYHAFNGPHGTLFDRKYVASDHVHPSTIGHQLIAALLMKVGLTDLPHS